MGDLERAVEVAEQIVAQEGHRARQEPETRARYEWARIRQQGRTQARTAVYRARGWWAGADHETRYYVILAVALVVGELLQLWRERRAR